MLYVREKAGKIVLNTKNFTQFFIFKTITQVPQHLFKILSEDSKHIKKAVSGRYALKFHISVRCRQSYLSDERVLICRRN